jgi:hypothetical protein
MPAGAGLAVASLILSLLIVCRGVYAGLRPHAPGSKATTGSSLLPNFGSG